MATLPPLCGESLPRKTYKEQGWGYGCYTSILDYHPHLTQALNTTSFFQLISQTWQVSVLLTQRLTLSPLPHTTSPSTKSSPGPTKRLWQKPCVFLFSLTEWHISQHWQTSCQIPRKETRSVLAQTLHRQPSLGVHCSWSAYHS